MSTTVIQMLSPMKIFSPSLRLRTNMSLLSLERGGEWKLWPILRHEPPRRAMRHVQKPLFGGDMRPLSPSARPGDAHPAQPAQPAKPYHFLICPPRIAQELTTNTFIS